MPALAVDDLFQVGRFSVYVLLRKSWTRLHMRDASPRSHNLFQVARLFAQVACKPCCWKAGLGSTCKVPLLEANYCFLVGRLLAQFLLELASIVCSP